MVFPVFTFQQFKDFLIGEGYEIATDEYWESHNRLMVSKDGHSFPLQIQEKYFFPIVVKTCETLGIKAPADHQSCYDDYEAYKKRRDAAKEEEGEE